MANKIATLKDEENNDLYPITLSSCVYDADNIPMPDKANKDLSNVTYPQIVADGVAKTGAGDRVIESYVSSDSKIWYRKWASGWKECGMNYTSKISNTSVLFTLPIEFVDTNYIAVANGAPDDYASGGIYIRSHSTTQVRIGTTATYGKGFRVYCCGY